MAGALGTSHPSQFTRRPAGSRGGRGAARALPAAVRRGHGAVSIRGVLGPFFIWSHSVFPDRGVRFIVGFVLFCFNAPSYVFSIPTEFSLLPRQIKLRLGMLFRLCRPGRLFLIWGVRGEYGGAESHIPYGTE